MDLKINKLALKGNEKFLLEYWNRYISDWKIDEIDIFDFCNKAIDDMWIYAAFHKDMCCGILVNEEGNENAIWLLHVTDNNRNKGIGSSLLNMASNYVKGIWKAGSGSGYWWQGVPVGCGDEFYEKYGFKWSWTSIDMILNLKTWNIKDNKKIHTVHTIKESQASELLEMLKEESDLCNWFSYYKAILDERKYDNIFVTYEDGEISGCAMLLEENQIRFKSNFPGKTGGLGCVGVREKFREKGTGTELVNRITLELKERGYEFSFIGYTWLEEWYGKLGYENVYRFKMGERKNL